MRTLSDGLLIHGIDVKFDGKSCSCNICGWGDVMIYKDLWYKGRRYDFCKRHNNKVITAFIKGGYEDYHHKIHYRRTDGMKAFERLVLKGQKELNL